MLIHEKGESELSFFCDSGGIGYFADLRLLRLTPFPWNPRQCATRKPYFVRYLLLFLSIVSCKPDNAQKNKSHSFEWLSCCALRS